MDKTLYYNPNKMLSYNRILSFVNGARGIGKSYSLKKYCINRFLKHGEQFIYVRRYKQELKKITSYFDDVAHEFPDVHFKVKGRQFFINDKLAGWAIPLSAWQSEKSNAYPNVTTILFDEFLREKDKSGYLPNEVEALLNLMDTVFRGRENGRCICLSNSTTITNPYYIYFGLVPDINKRFNAYESILIEIPDSADFSAERRKTKFGRLIDGTNYGDMSLDNEFVNDSSLFIEKRSKNSKFKFLVVYQGLKMGIWVDTQLGLMYLSTEYDPDSKLSFAILKDDLDENTQLVSSWKQNFYISRMVSAFLKGLLRFDSQVVRNIAYEMFNKMNVQ